MASFYNVAPGLAANAASIASHPAERTFAPTA
jgi:hypothetical protein